MAIPGSANWNLSLARVSPPWRALTRAALAEMKPKSPITTSPTACTYGIPTGTSISSEANRA